MQTPSFSTYGMLLCPMMVRFSHRTNDSHPSPQIPREPYTRGDARRWCTILPVSSLRCVSRYSVASCCPFNAVCLITYQFSHHPLIRVPHITYSYWWVVCLISPLYGRQHMTHLVSKQISVVNVFSVYDRPHRFPLSRASRRARCTWHRR